MLRSTATNHVSFRIIHTSLLFALISSTNRDMIPTLAELGTDGSLAYLYPLQLCEGPCLDDSDCVGDLMCFKRTGSEPVPGCSGSGSSGTSYCTDVTYSSPSSSVFTSTTGGGGPPDLAEIGLNGEPSLFYPLQHCEGECYNDDDCVGNLVCFDRSDREPVPGCFGDGQSGTNYCIEFTDLVPESPPTNPPTPAAFVPAPTAPSSSVYPLGLCEGECFNDSQCEGDLLCFHRSGLEPIPGCLGEGDFGKGYCAQIIATPGSVIYQPGQANVFQNGLQLSQGLLSRVIAVSGSPVKFDTTGGTSSVAFHDLPDGAAVFSRPETDGWVYVSNSEASSGGVGAIYFNSKGQVTDYQKLLSGTSRNCGCGKTFYNTFLSGEEQENGLVWEVDPWGSFGHVTVVGNVRAKYESSAYDNRNTFNPRFFATIDEPDGPLLRFSPDMNTVLEASETGDYTNFLQSAGAGAKWEYLVLNYDTDTTGTFTWTTNIDEGRDSAGSRFSGLEGLDVYEGILYMTAKEDRKLFILDLDKLTFLESSTQSGAFDSEPDQIARLVDPDGILYFCESSKEGSGVHGRDTQGNYFTILQADFNSETNGGVGIIGETTGLAFSPDKMFMYVSFQQTGKLLEIRRADGLPFNGKRLDIKYHSS